MPKSLKMSLQNCLCDSCTSAQNMMPTSSSGRNNTPTEEYISMPFSIFEDLNSQPETNDFGTLPGDTPTSQGWDARRGRRTITPSRTTTSSEEQPPVLRREGAALGEINNMRTGPTSVRQFLRRFSLIESENVDPGIWSVLSAILENMQIGTTVLCPSRIQLRRSTDSHWLITLRSTTGPLPTLEEMLLPGVYHPPDPRQD
ncbi:hypothetical protein [Mosquito VEM virus SDBVL G]|uniref:Uncharacterized protein n=1 Tax=Mosquito VEM virus SDBVL G TaxID=1034805 RepID=F6KIE1_9VIRU|nr:hypothetical protein [Mosquito VEM virus SDBVL G]AEF58772.1 hypothetical protein [Mosquito VEM virus SDBVL G]